MFRVYKGIGFRETTPISEHWDPPKKEFVEPRKAAAATDKLGFGG